MPKTQPVDIAVREPQGAMMRVILTLARLIGHGKRSGERLAGRTDDGPDGRRAVHIGQVLGKQFAVDLDHCAPVGLLHSHFGTQPRGASHHQNRRRQAHCPAHKLLVHGRFSSRGRDLSSLGRADSLSGAMPSAAFLRPVEGWSVRNPAFAIINTAWPPRKQSARLPARTVEAPSALLCSRSTRGYTLAVCNRCMGADGEAVHAMPIDGRTGRGCGWLAAPVRGAADRAAICGFPGPNVPLAVFGAGQMARRAGTSMVACGGLSIGS